MDKFEKILEIPACYIKREVADRIARLIHSIAEEQINADYIQALRQVAPYLKLTPDQAVTQYAGNTDLRQLLAARKDRTTFISPHGSVQYAGRDVLYDEIPMDPSQIIIDVPGISGKYLNITINTDLMQVFPLHTASKILIQGSDRSWVNGLYEELQGMFLSTKKVVRDSVYRWFKPLGFLAFLALCFLEFRVFQLFRTDFTILMSGRGHR